jgi:4a-hydroxytetrahydrobiopterin dehydratase
MTLANENCVDKAEKLDEVAAEMLSTELTDWLMSNGSLEKTYRFRNFHETMAFANAVAYIAHQQNHHPAIDITFGRCKLTFNTHSAGGLSRNDFICASRVDQLVKAS